jgi:hypothetical protein
MMNRCRIQEYRFKKRHQSSRVLVIVIEQVKAISRLANDVGKVASLHA